MTLCSRMRRRLRTPLLRPRARIVDRDSTTPFPGPRTPGERQPNRWCENRPEESRRSGAVCAGRQLHYIVSPAPCAHAPLFELDFRDSKSLRNDSLTHAPQMRQGASLPLDTRAPATETVTDATDAGSATDGEAELTIRRRGRARHPTARPNSPPDGETELATRRRDRRCHRQRDETAIDETAMAAEPATATKPIRPPNPPPPSPHL